MSAKKIIPVLLRPPEAAERLNRSESTLHYWRMTGVGPPFFRSRGRVYYDADELAAWLDNEIHTGTPR